VGIHETKITIHPSAVIGGLTLNEIEPHRSP